MRAGNQWCCWVSLLAAGIESWLSMCTENATPLNRDITHHCRLEHVSTARYTLLTRCDIIRMSQPVWLSLSLPFLSLSLSSCLCSVSIYSPLLCCTSPQLPVFCSFGLFSFHLSLPLLCLPSIPPSLLPPSLPPVLHPSICSRLQSCLCEWSSSGRVVTTPHTGAELFYGETQCTTEKQLFFISFFPPLSLPLFTRCLSGICSLLCCISSIFSLTRSPWRWTQAAHCWLGTNVVIFKPAILEAINSVPKLIKGQINTQFSFIFIISKLKMIFFFQEGPNTQNIDYNRHQNVI